MNASNWHRPMKLYQAIGDTLKWRRNLHEAEVAKPMWEGVCEERLEMLQGYLPSGSGFDAGCRIDIDRSSDQKIVILAEFHHMDQNGYYDGWTAHEVIVTPTLCEMGFNLRITGKNKNNIKIYLYELFNHILRTELGKNQ